MGKRVFRVQDSEGRGARTRAYREAVEKGE